MGRLKRAGGADAKGSAKTMGLIFGESEIENLRNSIQVICQSTNPLGKCMDYVHDDLLTMSKEHDKWQSDYRTSFDALEEQKSVAPSTTCLQLILCLSLLSYTDHRG